MADGPSGLCRHVWICRTCGTHGSDWPELFVATAPPPEVGTISWQAQAYVKLGLVRDMMIPADVLTVQQFIGPIPESAPSPLGTIK